MMALKIHHCYFILAVILLVLAILLPTIILRTAPRSENFNANESEEILSKPFFRNATELYAQMQSLVKSLDWMCSMEKIGDISRPPSKSLPVYKIFISGGRPKPKVLIISGIIQYTWEGVQICLNIAREAVVKKYNLVNIFSSYDLEIIPVVNPHDIPIAIHNREAVSHSQPVTPFVGKVDFFYNFDYDHPYVTAEKKNSNTYWKDLRGERPFSEPESRFLRDYFKKNQDSIDVIFVLHTTSGNESSIIYPFYRGAKSVPLLDYLMSAASIATDGKYLPLLNEPQELLTTVGRMDYWLHNKTKIFKVFSLNTTNSLLTEDRYSENSHAIFKDIAEVILDAISSITRISARLL